MNKLLLFTLLLTQILFPQLKEMEVKPTENRGGIPIFRDYPDKAGIIFYTQFDNLSFYSSYGIVEVKGDPAGGKYVVVIEPVRQTVEVRAPGFKTEMIRLTDLQPRDVLYYEVLPKKEEGISVVTEVGITVQVTPQDATILLDGLPFPNNVTTKVFLGSHKLRVEKAGYGSNVQEIVVTPEKTLFQINLEKVSLSPITIKSNPSNGTVYINNELKGTTEFGIFLYSGSYELRIELPGYLPIIETIQVSPTTDKTKNVFSYNLVRNKGILELSVTPANAIVSLNSEQSNITGSYELNPGIYDLEVKASQYDTFKEQIEIKRGETLKKTVNLTKNTGILELSVTPSNAIVSLNSEQSNITGSYELNPGIYDLEVKASQYDTFKEQIEIKRGETLKKSVNLTKNTGVLALSIQPAIAAVNINKEKKSGNRFELMPGVYEIEIAAETFYSEIFTVTIEKGKTIERTVTLKQKTGALQFTIKPLEAKASLSQNGVEKYSWEGINIIDNIPEGMYDLTAKAPEYKSFTSKITIREGQTAIEDIQMTPGSDTPEWMVFVEGGTFSMGSIDKDSDEKPVHQVTVGSFFIGRTEITFDSFSKFITATGFETDAEDEGWSYVLFGSRLEKESGVDWRCDTKGNIRRSGEKNHPVIHVSWNDAVNYCNWLSEKEGLQKAYSGSGESMTCDFNSSGYRLPTEAEWEYAARGGNKSNGYEYSGSNDIDAVGSFGAFNKSGNRTIEQGTSEVGRKQANELGLYDMSGNVWEWCWDWYGGYNSGSLTNPRGPSAGSSRVLRGGSWGDSAGGCRVANRSNYGPVSRSFDYGFRLVRTKN